MLMMSNLLEHLNANNGSFVSAIYYNEVIIHYKNKDIKKEKLSYKKKSGISDEIVDRIIDQLN